MNATSPGSAAFTSSVIEKILGLPFTENNIVHLLKSGSETFQTMLDLVSSARELICIEFYIFKDDNTGEKFAELLKAKARQGVKVYLLYDHFGSFLTSRSFWSDLKRAGVYVRVSHPFAWSFPQKYIYRNHKKLLIVDGIKAVTGGFNIADEYHGYFRKRKKIWRDTGIYLEGPIAASLLNIFERSWNTWKGEALGWNARKSSFNQGVPVIPVFANSGTARRKMRRMLLYSIKHARDSIFITTAYFIPGRRILRALILAANRGVKLKLLLPGQSDVLAVYYAGRSYYRQLLMAGAELYNYQGAILHAKTSVFDGCWSIIGSTNVDMQSLRRNEESNVGILDKDFGAQMIGVYHNDLQNSFKIDLDTWEKRPFYQKIMEKVCYQIMMKL